MAARLFGIRQPMTRVAALLLEQRSAHLADGLMGRALAHADQHDALADRHDVAAFDRGAGEILVGIAPPDLEVAALERSGGTCRLRAAAASPACAPARTSGCRSRRCRSSTTGRAETGCWGSAAGRIRARRRPLPSAPSSCCRADRRSRFRRSDDPASFVAGSSSSHGRMKAAFGSRPLRL